MVLLHLGLLPPLGIETDRRNVRKVSLTPGEVKFFPGNTGYSTMNNWRVKDFTALSQKKKLTVNEILFQSSNPRGKSAPHDIAMVLLT